MWLLDDDHAEEGRFLGDVPPRLTVPPKANPAEQFFTVTPEELQMRHLIGQGSRGEVFKADWKREFGGCTTCIVVAAKRLHTDTAAMYRDREALTLMTEHPNLVRCFNSTLDPPYVVLSEYCAGGSLVDLLYNSTQEICLRQQVKILYDVSSAMSYLHGHTPCILHRDLKSGNVLLAKPIVSKGQEPFAKVADFGLARPAIARSLLTPGVGTWRWMAPEVFQQDDEGAGVRYDGRADVFSFSMTAYEVLERKIPYADTFGIGVSDPRIGIHICRGNRPNLSTNIPEELGGLVELGWAADPNRRPTFYEIETVLGHLLDEVALGKY